VFGSGFHAKKVYSSATLISDGDLSFILGELLRECIY